MEILKTINDSLIDEFGKAWNNWPIYRVVWSEDQFEKRLTHFTDAGIQLLIPEVRELPKYRQWIHNKYVLEQLITVPEVNKEDLVEKITYEPLFVFEDKHGNPLPPKFEAAKFVIDSVRAAMGKSSLGPKYVDPEIEAPKEVRAARINKLQDELFGNETSVGDALAHDGAIVVPSNFNQTKKQEVN